MLFRQEMRLELMDYVLHQERNHRKLEINILYDLTEFLC